MEPDPPANLFYRGSSMKGTFKPGDRLILEMVPFMQIKKGDVIVFRSGRAEPGDFIVHRVAETTPAGLATRGDNCRAWDSDPVAEASVIGRVCRRDRRGRERRVAKGGAGQMRAALLHGRQQAARWLRFILRKPYAALRASGLVARLWHPDIERVRFDSADGSFVKYLHQGKTVATSWANRKCRTMKRPFDLVIREFSD